MSLGVGKEDRMRSRSWVNISYWSCSNSGKGEDFTGIPGIT